MGFVGRYSLKVPSFCIGIPITKIRRSHNRLVFLSWWESQYQKRHFSLKQIHGYMTPGIVYHSTENLTMMMLTLSSLAAPEVVVMTTFGATNDCKVGTLTTLGCQYPWPLPSRHCELRSRKLSFICIVASCNAFSLGASMSPNISAPAAK